MCVCVCVCVCVCSVCECVCVCVRARARVGGCVMLAGQRAPGVCRLGGPAAAAAERRQRGEEQGAAGRDMGAPATRRRHERDVAEW